MKISLPAAILLISLMLLMSTAVAQPPQYINYQGRLTDDAGEPITNTSPGAVMTFTIWNHESDSDPGYERWSSGNVYVPVEDGLFDFQLGPLPDNLFQDYPDLWLGIQIAADPELSPRTKLISAGYACHAGTVDDIYVNESGDAMTGDLLLFNGRLALWAIGSEQATLAAQTDRAYITLKGANMNTKVEMEGTINGGTVQVNNGIGITSILLDGGAAGDPSVILPESAINSDEILDEPGIANNGSTDYVTLSNTMDDLQSLTIEIPASGYIYLEGWCHVIIGGSTSENYAYIQIDETSGGTHTSGYFTMVGMYEYPNSDYFYYSVYVNRIYFKDAGTYDFILEGKKMLTTHTIYCAYPNLTATYYPTSYTPIKAFSSSPEGHPEAKPVAVIDPITNDEKIMYEFDLRHYELKAKEARIEAKEARIKALEAELELRQAQREAKLQSERTGDTD